LRHAALSFDDSILQESDDADALQSISLDFREAQAITKLKD
jgi:hypothetical protein